MLVGRIKLGIQIFQHFHDILIDSSSHIESGWYYKNVKVDYVTKLDLPIKDVIHTSPHQVIP